MEIDYTRQLEELVRAVEHKEALPSWMVAIISGVVGLFVGAALEPIKVWISDGVQKS